MKDSKELLGLLDKENEETKIPDGESIRLNCLWLMEFYPPESINNLIIALENLDWNNSFGSSKNNKLSELIKNVRENNSFSWHNIGYILPPNSESFLKTNESILPEGVLSIKLSMVHSIESTTILIFQFIFTEEYAYIYEESLNKQYHTFIKKSKNMKSSYITPNIQKSIALSLAKTRTSLKCKLWIKNNLSGYYTSNNLIDKMPVCDFITLKKEVPFEQKQKFPLDYLQLLNLSSTEDVWTSNELEGLYFKFTIPKDGNYPYMLLTGKLSEILKNEDLKAYGKNRTSQIVNYINYFDNTLVKFGLFYLLHTYLWQISKLRDDISNINFEKINKANNQLTKIAKMFAQLDGNVPSFTVELIKLCETKERFMLNAYEFYKYERVGENDELIEEKYELIDAIRVLLIEKSNSLLQSHNNLRQSFDTTSKIINSITNDKLSKNNFKLQIVMLLLSLIMLLLTLITIYANTENKSNSLYNIIYRLQQIKFDKKDEHKLTIEINTAPQPSASPHPLHPLTKVKKIYDLTSKMK